MAVEPKKRQRILAMLDKRGIRYRKGGNGHIIVYPPDNGPPMQIPFSPATTYRKRHLAKELRRRCGIKVKP